MRSVVKHVILWGLAYLNVTERPPGRSEYLPKKCFFPPISSLHARLRHSQHCYYAALLINYIIIIYLSFENDFILCNLYIATFYNYGNSAWRSRYTYIYYTILYYTILYYTVHEWTFRVFCIIGRRPLLSTIPPEAQVLTCYQPGIYLCSADPQLQTESRGTSKRPNSYRQCFAPFCTLGRGIFEKQS